MDDRKPTERIPPEMHEHTFEVRVVQALIVFYLVVIVVQCVSLWG